MNLRLKRLELSGFKSFADRTVLEFEGTLTGIVGPNGCGKSNVVDAIRWVLGEQRARSMRGSEMADVVFKGSTSRPAMSVAEVTLVLDNSSGGLEGMGAEVAITRRVDKSGEGEYLLDGERVRLKDLRDLLYDTGLGSRGYAVLEQGKIDAVLSANPLERRAVFEEAAGISRYRQRRKETESKLARAEQDVERVDDLVRELTSRVRSLKLQASKAERYVRARDEWRAERGRFLRHKVWALNAELEGVRSELVRLEQRAATLRGAREERDRDASRREEAQRDLAARVDALSSEVARLAGEGRALDERHAQLALRIEAWRATDAEETERAEQRAAQLEARSEELSAARRELDARREALARSEAAAREAARALSAARRAWRAGRGESAEQNERVLALLHEKTEARNTVHHLSEARAPLEARRQRAASRLLDARAAVESVRRAESEAREAREEAEARLEQAVAREAEAQREVAELAEEIEALGAERRELELERARVHSRLEALRDWEREREGLLGGARALLERLEAGEGPVPAEALAGVLADHVRTETRLARALDAALGDRALALVARQPEVVAPILRWLAQTGAGEVQLVVPAGAWPAFGAGGPAGADGVLGRLADELECDPGFAALAERLVGDVWLVPTVERALELSRRYPGLRFATPAGDLISDGAARGGHREIAQGAVGRRSQAAELEASAEELERRAAGAGARLAELRTRRGELEERLAACAGEVRLRRAAQADAVGAERTAAARLADLDEALRVVQAEEGVIGQEVQSLESELEAARARLLAAERDFERENERLAELEARRHALEEERDQHARAESAAQIECTRARAEAQALERRATDLGEQLDETRGELERARRLASEARACADEAEAEIERLVARSHSIESERAAREVELGELRKSEQEGRAAIDALRAGLDGVTRELEACLGEVSARQLDQQRLELSRGELLARAREELELAEEELVRGFEPEEELGAAGALEALDARVSELRRALDRLGPVNTEALGELEETEERLEFLAGQRRDLAQARATLIETLAAINEESRRLFLETFEAVSRNFGVLFRQLFGGGRAELALEEGADPLEAGIQITARPPGREMLPIGLLSGGQRTMTALGLLFAVFQTRPSPFCVLDEVDAALDDANVGRFLAMLDGFRRDTQFVVVTHHKGSMAACEMLYGITMETKGVSRQVSVQFGEVDAFVPEITGNAEAASQTRREVAARSNGGPAERSVELLPRPRPAGGTDRAEAVARAAGDG